MKRVQHLSRPFIFEQLLLNETTAELSGCLSEASSLSFLLSLEIISDEISGRWFSLQLLPLKRYKTQNATFSNKYQCFWLMSLDNTSCIINYVYVNINTVRCHIVYKKIFNLIVAFTLLSPYALACSKAENGVITGGACSIAVGEVEGRIRPAISLG